MEVKVAMNGHPVNLKAEITKLQAEMTKLKYL